MGAVLIIDDDRETLAVLQEILEDVGTEVLCASSVAEAFQQLAAADPLPCLILLDLMMPERNGWDFRAAQQDEPRLARIPVVVMTASGVERESIFAAGFLRKPLDLGEILAVVRQHCGEGRGRRTEAS
jgi:CheY-like chemotaxis protein